MATAILDVGRRIRVAAANVMAVNIESRRRVEIMVSLGLRQEFANEVVEPPVDVGHGA